MFRYCILLFLALSFAAEAAPKNTNHHVILITIDGAAAFYFNDPKAPIPNLRKLAVEGVVAEGMKVSNPAVTWPNHTTLVTGVTPAKHSVLYNGLMVPDKRGELQRDQEKDKDVLVTAPTVYDLLHREGFTTAAINWPCTQNPKTLDDNFPDAPNPLRDGSQKLVQDLIAAKILESANDAAFRNQSPTKRDDIWTDAACYLLRTRPPNFMLFHLLYTDGTQHRVGPQCPETYEALGLADQQIGKLLDTLDKNGLRERTSILIVADHGFVRVHKQIVGNVLLRKAMLLETTDKQARVQAISEGGSLMVYLHAKATKDADRKKVIEIFKNHEGVAEIIEPKDFAEYGYPSPEKNFQMADLVVAARDGYSFSGLMMGDQTIVPAREGGTGSHGFLSTNPKMNAIFIASGRGILKGKTIGIIDNIDIAPTAAYLLGQNFRSADGKVLKQILETP